MNKTGLGEILRVTDSAKRSLFLVTVLRIVSKVHHPEWLTESVFFFELFILFFFFLIKNPRICTKQPK